MKYPSFLFTFILLLTAAGCSFKGESTVWPIEKSAQWYHDKGWISGCNYIPSTAINQLEMWQEDTFDPATIDRELGWAEELGFNAMRVFLHHLAWTQDAEGFKKRIDTYLDISSSHGIETMFVFLDDCWNETAAAGKQPKPQRGVHNSGWLKDPGALYFDLGESGNDYATDTLSIVKLLETYVKDILTTFADDPRILAWDLYNEPGGGQDPYRYYERSFPLLKDIFRWGHEVRPSQPMTAGIWHPRLTEMNRFQALQSDVITYHTYESLESHSHLLDTLSRFGKPMICTEYMARTIGSTFQTIMPMLRKRGVGAINWGFVSGKTNTVFAWATPLDMDEPPVWFHDILRKDGTPYSEEEIAVIRSVNRVDLPLVPYPETVKKTSGRFDAAGASVRSKGFGKEGRAIAKELENRLFTAAGRRSGTKITLLMDSSMAEEEYSVDITCEEIHIKASSVTGISYAVTTLKQLLPDGATTGEPSFLCDWHIPCMEIHDLPAFGYRGLLLDCSRHFFSSEEIHKVLELMAYYKLNRFHWHITDDHGWRLESKKYPLLTTVGGFRKGTMHTRDISSIDNIPYGGFYTQEEIKDIVSHAGSLGITVIPEIDLPAHMVSALAAYPWLGCTGGPYDVMVKLDIAPDILCAGKETSFEFLENLFDEVCELFPGKYIHIGGDECPKDKWNECPACQARMRELGIQDTPHASAGQYLQNYVTSRVQKILSDRGRNIIGWDEILEGNPAPGATVMSWRGVNGGIEAASKGFDVIMTPVDYCYLDYCQSDTPENEPISIGHYLPVEKCYSFNPLEGIPEGAYGHILGVQANLWTEFIGENDHLEYMLMPRMAAIAEDGWSSLDDKDYSRFKTAMQTVHLPRLSALGYNYRQFD